jgi:CBS domain-containing protein
MNAQRYVQEIMNEPVIAVLPDISAEEVTKQLAQHRIGAVPVVDRSLRVLGIIAEADLLAGAAGTARDAMSSPAVTVNVGTTVDEARTLLMARDIGRLPVVDGTGRLVGIVSRRDLLRSMLPGDAEVRRRVMDHVIDAGGEVYGIAVSDGNVWIRGRVGSRGEIPVLEQMLRETPGVKRLRVEFAYDVDDTATATATTAPEPIRGGCHDDDP